MKNRKKIISVLPIIVSAFSLAGCTDNVSSSFSNEISSSEEVHIHTKDDKYSFDENGHYHKCKTCDENIRFDYESHSFVEKEGVLSCSICFYSPNAEIDELFSKFKIALNNFYNDEEDVTFSSEFVSDIEIYNSTSLEKVSGTFNRNDGTFFAKGSLENTYSGYKSNSEYSIYIANEDGQYKEYMDNYGRGKPIYDGDNKTSQNQYDNYLSTAFDLDILSRLNKLDTFDEMKNYFNLYLGEGLLDFDSSYSFTVNDDSFSLNMSYSGITYSKTIWQKDEFESTITIKDGRITDFTETYKYDSTSPDGQTYLETRGTTTHLEKGFDREFYDSFKGKENYSETGLGTSYKLTLYLDDYKLLTYNQRINEKLSYASYDSYGTYYYDKECTKPYSGENLTSDITSLYIKPLENIPDDKALVWHVCDYEYISKFKDSFSYNEKNIASFPAIYDANYSYPLTVSYEAIDPHIIVNGEEVNKYTYSITLEGGKSYLIVNKAKYFVI